MVMVNNTGAFVLFFLLCAAWLSTARFHPTGAEINATSASMIGADATASTKSQPAAIIFEDEKSSKKVNVETETVIRNKGKKIVKPSLSSSSPPPPPPPPPSSLSLHHNNERRKRRLRRHWSDDEFDKGFVAFSADYHGPRHHPPKNN